MSRRSYQIQNPLTFRISNRRYPCCQFIRITVITIVYYLPVTVRF